MHGSLDLMSLMIEAGAEVDVTGNDGVKAIMLGAYAGDLDVVQYLISETGASIEHANHDNHTALFIAAQGGHVEVVRALLVAGAVVGATNNEGWTPLLVASLTGYAHITQILLEFGADPNQCNDSGETPLYMTCPEGHAEVVQLLIGHFSHSGVSSQTYDGLTAMSMAAKGGHLHVVRLLTEAGGNIDHQDNYGFTPLLSASYKRDSDVVQYLIDAGADLAITHTDGRST
jgi:ankyrin repeat protein